ncbi:MAG TPA: CBS domain-containing protein [Burkholderiaceae bacterium]|nr:CBS domain-containing protein [Burkholderiaceae bacterium]
MKASKAPEGVGLHQPGTYTSVTVDSPAISVMTDLRLVSAATIDEEATLSDATRTMISRGVRLLFVMGSRGELVGLITARDISGEAPMKLLQGRGAKFEDLRVADLMTPRAEIDVLDLSDVLHSEVGDIVVTLKAAGRQHALVAERDTARGMTRIRGLFSATQIGRQLGIAVQPFEFARTFAEIERALFD